MAEISPVTILFILILAIVFFALVSIHLLIRCIMERPSFPSHSQSHSQSQSQSHGSSNSFQLQHLFRLQDSGLDRALIDALPVFHYKDVVRSKDTFDCAVCLCEFSGSDELKWLPDCSHAFHVHCIETWLLSNNKCPLCRSQIGYGFSDSMRLSNVSFMSVRLGNFRNSDASVGSSSGSNIGARRCYSVGVFQYVEDDADLQVSLSSSRATVEARSSVRACSNITEIVRSKSDSHCVSKIWLWSKKGKFSGNLEDEVAVLPMHDRSDSV